jgi:H+/Cl- antiporter ClcA
VPTGVFLSSILVGFTVGQIYENAVENLFGVDNASLTALPLILGAACMLAANTRLSYSIVVLMLEATGSFTLAIPMILAVFTTKFVADLMNNSLFDREIRDL